ncbi:uncharacterized protein J7T54_004679 [Emericellopsis cladophorae]|uniref:Heterokaryon incompatibility domain-containing protein n=1 Tax=Emericellopsis cladophorae TaxID=2686198 RepID=A0A9P9Y6T8_9HYPO|nr:uncharacterized protein J7T54_004679 [Emericellopsis cladophorae]KAI6784133.1 hypothetical protein J7T54_004679 [Emericellopsis cladophorae]
MDLWCLSEPNRRKLFGDVIDKLESQWERHDRHLDNLHRLNPTIARNFETKSEKISNAPFRVLVPRGTRRRAVDGYVIVSWSWPNDGWTRATENPVLQPWPFPQDMVKSILDLRYEDEERLEGVWIDSLCINQQDDADKSLQIACMDAIYQNAARLVIVMEDVKIDHVAADALNRFNSVVQSARDRLSIALNVSDAGLIYDGPEQDKDWCFFMAALASLAIGEPGPLSMRQAPVALREGGIDGSTALSWLRRPTSAYTDGLAQESLSPATQSDNRPQIHLSATKEYIEIDLIFVGAPQRYVPSASTVEFIRAIEGRPEWQTIFQPGISHSFMPAVAGPVENPVVSRTFNGSIGQVLRFEV